MNPRLADFLSQCRSETYPEPRSSGHDCLTLQMGEPFIKQLPPGATVLDAGCGKGPALEMFRHAGIETVGISLSIEDVRDCRALGFNCVQMDQNDMPDDFTGKFEAVWARHVVEHSPVPLFTLREFARVLKPGGRLYMEVPAPNTTAHHERNLNHYSVLTPHAWASLLTRAGFECTTYQSISFEAACGPDLYFAFNVQKL
jgi:SAM-dependent methyltransferase